MPTEIGRPEFAVAHYFPAILSKLGHTVAIVGRAGGDSRPLAAAGVRVFEVGSDTPWLSGLRNAAREARPDIVHVLIHVGCGLYPLLMKAHPQTRFVLDIRSPLLRTGLLRFMVQAKNRLEVLGYHAIAAHSIESGWTVVSKRRTIHWLPPGVDISAIPAAHEVNSNPTATRLVYIGCLDRSRKLPQMVDAVLNASHDLQLNLDIYGRGEDESTIAAMLRQNGNAATVRLLGVVPRHELFSRLVHYDIGLSYVPRSLYDAAPPLKTLEFLASGLAVIATRTTGHALLIRDGENGLLVDEDPRSMAEGILRLARDRSLRTTLMRNARASIAAYDWEQIVKDRVLPLYESVL
jgi:glycosyltransferase involved in cell wall biosynthesis